MEMETSAPKTQETSPANFSSLGQFSERTQWKKGNRKGKTFEVPIKAFHCSKEGLQQRQTNFGSVTDQQLHPLSFFQDVNTQRSPPPTPSRILDNLDRPAGRLLACAHSAQKASLFGLPLQRGGLSVQMPPLWAQSGPKELYQISGACGSRNGQGRHMVPTIPGRSPNHSSIKGNLHSTNTPGTTDPEATGFYDQQEEVKTDPIASVQLAGRRLGPTIPLSSGRSGQNTVSPYLPFIHSTTTQLHQENCDATPGFSQLHRSVRPSDPHTPGYDKDHTTPVQIDVNTQHHSDSNSLEAETLQMEWDPNDTSTSRIANANANHSDGCLTSRLGVRNESAVLPGSVRRINEILYKHSRVADNLVCTSFSQHQEPGHTGLVRQHNGHRSSEKRKLTTLPSGISGRTDMEKSCQVQLDSHSCTHKGQVQCHSGSTLQRNDTVIRMVTTTTNIQEDPSHESKSGSRPFRNSSQLSTANLHSSMSGPRSSSNRCTDNGLGQMETPLPVPSYSTHFKIIGKTKSNSVHQCHPSDTGDPDETMVHGTSVAQSSIGTARNSTHTSCGGQSSDSPPLDQTSRVEVLKYAYYAKFPHSHRVVSLLTNPIRKSSQGDYERKWQYFCSFLRERGTPFNAITLHCVLDFLAYLFFDKGLQASTVAHYRSALTVPLRLQYNVDLSDSLVTTLLRAMFLQRPKAPTATPAWCLNKVLTYIDDLPSDLDIETSLQKCAFLMLLATGWRISELHACVRDTAYCHILDDSTLLIRPHPGFLAKNESTEKRWQHERIKPLKLQDNTPSKLCPVRSLQKYLHLSSRHKSGSLFLNHKTDKPLTVKQLSLAVCKLIRRADPLTNPKAHDIRKYAASCALSETMRASNMIDALHWRSPHTFWKFYMSPTSPLTKAAALPGISTSSVSVQGSSDQS